MSKKFKFVNMSITDSSKAKELISAIVEKSDTLDNEDILLLLSKKLGSSYKISYEDNYFTKQTEFTITK